jgi:hypothetical protein|tara:strand:+ start:1225 stop:1440 length:216 start_codon:yes stop_codon:yes gene_type:complete
MSRYQNRDPYWLTAKFNSNCAKCETTIRKGQRAFYYPSSRTIYCEADDCGAHASRDFAACMFDETLGSMEY